MTRERQAILGRFLREFQLWLMLETWGFVLCRMALAFFPTGALAVMVDQRWFGGTHSVSIALFTLIPLLLIPVGYAFIHRGSSLHQAFEMDERGDLKDRITSAWEFLSQESMTPEQDSQVRDAIRTAHDVDLASLVTLRESRLPRWSIAALCVFVASFFVPSVYHFPEVDASIDRLRALQAEEVETLREEVERLAADDEGLDELLRRLKEVEARFERGEIAQRDVMIALSRMDRALQERMKAMGAEAFNEQLNQVVPHLMASEAARAVAQAIKESRLADAAKELGELESRLQQDQLAPEQKEQLALNMAAAAAKLGPGENGTLGEDFDAAAKSMKAGDKAGTKSALESIQGKMRQSESLRKMQSASKSLSMCKAGMGSKSAEMAKTGSGESDRRSDTPSNSAGRGSAEALGDAKRLEDSYREMLQVQGMVGEGPVESEVEITEGQTSASNIGAKDVYNEYAAVAEQALDQEGIPLSHRFHVKRYFQAIRPEE